MKTERYFEFNIVITTDAETDAAHLLNLFVDWVANNKWRCDGELVELDEKGEPLDKLNNE